MSRCNPSCSPSQITEKILCVQPIFYLDIARCIGDFGKKSVSPIPVLQPVTWNAKINRTHVETSQNAMEAGTLRCAKVTLYNGDGDGKIAIMHDGFLECCDIGSVSEFELKF